MVWMGVRDIQGKLYDEKERFKGGTRTVLRGFSLHSSRGQDNKQFLGIGAYGWEESKWVGITQELFEKFLEWLKYAKEEYLFPEPPRIEYWEGYNLGTLYLYESITGRKLSDEEIGELEEIRHNYLGDEVE